MSEKYYDEVIAPILLDVSKKCEAAGIPFLAAVEYEKGRIAETSFVPSNAGLFMVSLRLCAQSGVNVDGYMISLRRYCEKNGIDFSGSVYLTRFS